MPNLNGRFVALLLLVPTAGFAARAGAIGTSGLCALIEQLQGVFHVLRLCAFVGAGFMLAKYGWEAVSKGKLGGKDSVTEGLQAIGVPMIIGFSLLFSIGIVLGFLTNGENFGCAALTTGW